MKVKKQWFIIISLVCTILFIMRVSTAPKTRSVGKIVKEYEGTYESIGRYLSYGSGTYGKYGFDPRRDNARFYDGITTKEDEYKRAWKGGFEMIGIGFINTIGMTSSSDSDLINEIENVKAVYGSTKLGSTGDRARFMLESGFAIGAFICCFLIPIICWIYYLVQLSNLKSEKKRQIKIILNSKETAQDYKEKMDTLNRLRELNSINKEEYDKKINSLRNEMYSKLVKSSDNKRSKLKQEALEDAFNMGVITEDEYKAKKSNQTIITESNPKIIFNKSNCPVCKSVISETDEKCPSCGIIVREK